jgi:26S proteasome regulatory subunit T3
MGDVIVENLANTAIPHKRMQSTSIPNIDSLEGINSDSNDEYSTLKKLQRHLE